MIPFLGFERSGGASTRAQTRRSFWSLLEWWPGLAELDAGAGRGGRGGIREQRHGEDEADAGCRQ
jgi:hypothetical protein